MRIPWCLTFWSGWQVFSGCQHHIAADVTTVRVPQMALADLEDLVETGSLVVVIVRHVVNEGVERQGQTAPGGLAVLGTKQQCHAEGVEMGLQRALRWRHNGYNGVSYHQPHDVYSTVYSSAGQKKHQSSASLAFVWGIHRWPVNSPHKWPVTRIKVPFDDVMMRQQSGYNSFMNIITTRYVDGTPMSEVTPVTIWYIRPPHHGHTSQ